MLRTLLSLTLISAILVPGLARADAKGDKVIGLMDKSMTTAKDQHFIHRVVTKEPGKAKRTLTMDVHIKGTEWRRVEFLAPGDIKGMKILVLSLDQMYVYMPAYRKVRRVAGHTREQGFMGTTFSHDEISIVTYGPTFAGKLLSEDDRAWKVEAIRRPGKTFRHKKVLFTISKKYRQPLEIKYYNEKNELMKTEVRSDYVCEGKVCQPKRLKLTDHTRNEAWSEIICDKWEVNTGVSDRFFTVRALQRRR